MSQHKGRPVSRGIAVDEVMLYYLEDSENAAMLGAVILRFKNRM
jgi:hypothetical protein